MKRFQATMLAILAIGSTSFADDDADRMRVKAVMALQMHCAKGKDKAAAPAAAAAPKADGGFDLTKPLPTYEAAVQIARIKRVPVLVSVGGIHCVDICTKLRPEIPSAHIPELWGDKTPHIIVICSDDAGQIWRSGTRWQFVPDEATVRKAAADLKESVAAPKQQQPAIYQLLRDNCPNGNCPKR